MSSTTSIFILIIMNAINTVNMPIDTKIIIWLSVTLLSMVVINQGIAIFSLI